MSAAENLIPLHFLFDEMEETIMEKEYKTGLKYAMRELSEQYRAEHQYTLEEMAEQLDIALIIRSEEHTSELQSH